MMVIGRAQRRPCPFIKQLIVRLIQTQPVVLSELAQLVRQVPSGSCNDTAALPVHRSHVSHQPTLGHEQRHAQGRTTQYVERDVGPGRPCVRTIARSRCAWASSDRSRMSGPLSCLRSRPAFADRWYSCAYGEYRAVYNSGSLTAWGR